VFGADWYALQLPTHLFHFTARTLARVLERGGWRLERVMWQRDPKNLLHSLALVFESRGWDGGAAWLRAAATGAAAPRARFVLGQLLGRLRASGRLTAWAVRA
jgi:hypothetical protein